MGRFENLNGFHRRLRQVGLLTAVVVAHVALLLLLNHWRTPVVALQSTDIIVSLVEGNAFVTPKMADEIRKAKAEPTVTPRSIVSTSLKVKRLKFIDIRNALPLIELDQTPAELTSALNSDATSSPPSPVASADGKRCEIFELVQAALQSSQPVKAAIGFIPAKARSVANAILIWDGRWADPESMGGAAALQPIEKVVLDSVANVSLECQGDIVRGPRLITVGDQHDTTILAFGSGVWKWSDLLANALRP